MSVGDEVVVIDAVSARCGSRGTIVGLTREGDLYVEFDDGVAVMRPLQVENDPRLITAALENIGYQPMGRIA